MRLGHFGVLHWIGGTFPGCVITEAAYSLRLGGEFLFLVLRKAYGCLYTLWSFGQFGEYETE